MSFFRIYAPREINQIVPTVNEARVRVWLERLVFGLLSFVLVCYCVVA